MDVFHFFLIVQMVPIRIIFVLSNDTVSANTIECIFAFPGIRTMVNSADNGNLFTDH